MSQLQAPQVDFDDPDLVASRGRLVAALRRFLPEDALLEQDPRSRVACSISATTTSPA